MSSIYHEGQQQTYQNLADFASEKPALRKRIKPFDERLFAGTVQTVKTNSEDTWHYAEILDVQVYDLGKWQPAYHKLNIWIASAEWPTIQQRGRVEFVGQIWSEPNRAIGPLNTHNWRPAITAETPPTAPQMRLQGF